MRRSSSFFLGSLRRHFASPKWDSLARSNHRVLSSLGNARDSVILNSNIYHQHVRFSGIGILVHNPYLRTEVNEPEKRGVEFVSVENIKPSCPTRNHLLPDHKMLHGVMKERIHNHISRESSLERIKSPYSLPSKNRSYSNCSSPAENFVTVDGDIVEEVRAMLASEVRLKRSIQHLGDKVNANLVDIRSLKAQLMAEKEKTQQMEKENMELKAQHMKNNEQAKAELLITIFETEEGQERMTELQKEWKSTYMTSLEYQNDLSFFSRAFLESGFNSCKAQVLAGNVLDKSENLEFLDLDKAFEEALELGDFLWLEHNFNMNSENL